MEITFISKDAIKIRSKKASLAVDPTPEVKTAADAILMFHGSSFYSFPKIEGSRLMVWGAGDYEVAGIKISSIRSKDSIVHTVNVDGMSMLLAQSQSLKESKTELGESQIVVLKANESLDSSAITALSPRVVVLYERFASEIAKSLGKVNLSPVSKYVTSLEKLPAEMEVVVLG